MPRICYVEKRISADKRLIIEQADEIVGEYEAQGFDLTLRQLYYQFVARDLIANKQSEYKRLGGIINDARLAGLIDWNSITDRTRNLRSNAHWADVSDIIGACANQFRLDLWADQPEYVEAWIEKDALVGVLESACADEDVPYFSCRGYTSQSEVWGAAMRLVDKVRAGKRVTILHLGDHDPSGIDMTRDIQDRLDLFMLHHTHSSATVKRIALNMDQVEEHGPPPNPAKMTDSRFAQYLRDYGDESWELDALDPTTLTTLIQSEIHALRDDDLWAESVEEQDAGRARLREIAEEEAKRA